MKSIIMTLATLGVGAAALGAGGCEVTAWVDRSKIEGTRTSLSSDAGKDGAGGDAGATSCSNPSQCPETGNACLQVTCDQGLCGTSVRLDESCATGMCDGQGRCVAPSCANRQVDTGETDVDCGGKLCPPCANFMKCLVGADCVSKLCDPISFTCGG